MQLLLIQLVSLQGDSVPSPSPSLLRLLHGSTDEHREDRGDEAMPSRLDQPGDGAAPFARAGDGGQRLEMRTASLSAVLRSKAMRRGVECAAASETLSAIAAGGWTGVGLLRLLLPFGLASLTRKSWPDAVGFVMGASRRISMDSRASSSR